MSKEILNIVSAANVIDVEFFQSLDLADFSVVSQTSDKQSQNVETVLRYVGSNPDYPMTARIGWYRKTGIVNVSLKLTTFVMNDDDADDVRYDECSATLAWSMPGNTGVPDAADLMVLLQNLLGIVAQSATVGVLDTAQLAKLSLGITDLT